jgi:uncharacterized protein YqjF (DUF2071 family)
MPSSPFDELDHRPTPLPRQPWVMAQRWEDLLFAHWPCDAAALASLLPDGLELDTFDGRAWVGVVPFRMSGVRLRWMPPIPGTSAFPELNARTYVRRGSHRGVWFFSLDAASALAVSAARRWFFLPYFRAEMLVSPDGDAVRYSSTRTDPRGPDATFDASYRPTGPVERAAPGSLAHWLTERYCLFAADQRGRLYRGDIHHAPWPLQPAEADISHNTVAEAAGLALDPTQPLLHFARALDVRIWSLRAA